MNCPECGHSADSHVIRYLGDEGMGEGYLHCEQMMDCNDVGCDYRPCGWVNDSAMEAFTREVEMTPEREACGGLG